MNTIDSIDRPMNSVLGVQKSSRNKTKPEFSLHQYLDVLQMEELFLADCTSDLLTLTSGIPSGNMYYRSLLYCSQIKGT